MAQWISYQNYEGSKDGPTCHLLHLPMNKFDLPHPKLTHAIRLNKFLQF